MVAFARAAVGALLISIAGALRRKSQRVAGGRSCPTLKTTSQVKTGELGEVDGLYTFGAPGTASPGLRHQGNADGIFPGLRTWLTCCWGFVDIVSSIMGTIWMYHPLMAAEEIELDKQAVKFAATDATTHLPSSALGSPILHLKERYHNVIIQRGCQKWTDFSEIGQLVAYSHSPSEVYEWTRGMHWTVGAYAYFNGTNDDLGEEYSYLLQNPDTLDCILTFQGSDDNMDWIENVKFLPTRFCGLVDQDETCPLTGFSECKTRNPRGSFVHRGFVQHLRAIIHTKGWQTNIQPNLGKCSAVHVTGQSLGGAAAELFTACVSQRLQPGDFGYEDYKRMYWTKGVPEKIDTANLFASASFK